MLLSPYIYYPTRTQQPRQSNNFLPQKTKQDTGHIAHSPRTKLGLRQFLKPYAMCAKFMQTAKMCP